MGFWISAFALVLLVVAVLARAILRGGRGAQASAQSGEVPEIALYREQLAAVEQDQAAGRVSAEEAERLTLEIQRRILDADKAAKAEAKPKAAPGGTNRGLVVTLAALLVAGAGGLYWQLGAPGYPDMPVAKRLGAAQEFYLSRPSQAVMIERINSETAMAGFADPDVDPEFLELMEKLRLAVETRPDDLRGHELLLRNEVTLGNYGAAAIAQQNVIRLKGGAATSEDFLLLAQLWITEARGYVSPQAEGALKEALNRDENNLAARYYWGVMRAQTGRPDLAFRTWRPLAERGPANAPWMRDLRQQIQVAAQDAGVDYQLPALPPMAGARGPSQEDMAAAADMSPEDRQQMIRGMVEQLEGRLADEGGPPQDWARLIGALGVLGDTEKANAILTEARAVFAAHSEGLAMIEAAAAQAGLGE